MTKEEIKDYSFRITQGSRTDIIVVMYDLAIKYQQDAIKAFNDDDRPEFRAQCLNAVRVVDDLIEALDFSYELAMPLLRVYEYISREISGAVIKNDIEALNRCIRYLGSLKESFEKVAAQDSSGPVMGNSQSVYAGLTYGKGTLNENVTAENMNRGFSV